METIVIRYWFEFDFTQIEDLPAGLPLGRGITAYSYSDAISILKQKVFKGQAIPELKNKMENIDIRTLDQGHVIPNMKDPTLRGIWFPLGYDRRARPTTKCIIDGADKEDIFYFFISATAYT